MALTLTQMVQNRTFLFRAIVRLITREDGATADALADTFAAPLDRAITQDESTRMVKTYVLEDPLNRVQIWNGWKPEEIQALHAELVSAGREVEADAFARTHRGAMEWRPNFGFSRRAGL
jgi:hypothetical protein